GPAVNGSVSLIDGHRALFTPAANYNGTGSFTFTASDGSLSDTATVTITVTPVNDAPVAGDVALRTDEDTPVGGTVGAVALDGPALTFNISVVPSNGVASVSSGGAFTYTPNANFFGSDSFTVTVTDGAGGSDTATVTVTIDPVNDAPVLHAIGDRTVAEGAQLAFTASTTDVDSATLSYRLEGAPAGASIGAASGLFTWTPAEGDGPGDFTFTVVVSDGSLEDRAAITVTVQEVNQAPTVAPVGDRPVGGGTLVSYTASASDADLPAQTLTYAWTVTRGGVAFASGNAAAFSFTPDDEGTYSV